MDIFRLVTKKFKSNSKSNYSEAIERVFRFFDRKIKHNDIIIVTPGGFIYDDSFPERIVRSAGWGSKISEFSDLAKYAEELLYKKFLKKEIRKILKEGSSFFTIGFDLDGPTSAELVAVYDTQNEEIIKWTGKSYPTRYQENVLFHIKDIESHFLMLNNERLLILGCHDLNIFSPRSKANRLSDSERGIFCSNFISKCQEFHPTVVIQHPHTTDSSRIWSQGWSGVRGLFPDLKSYCSGICYDGRGQRARSKIESVLKATKSFNVEDIVV